ncbi:apolipoprotein D-like [Scyliorhinus canicula]|uniref:apolipoprotein D-like n=1 Tax=Scyliorhinus canicula TaxID=7830 RepID=UPI0018F3A4B2|nr:apolipoprotein D-like [Scyliorhinus canicula]
MLGRLLMLLVLSICFTRGSFRSCPKIPVQKNFTLSEFMGMWFEIEALSSRLIKGDCITHTFHQGTDNWIHVNTTEKRKDGKRLLYMGKVSPADVNQAAKLQYENHDHCSLIWLGATSAFRKNLFSDREKVDGEDSGDDLPSNREYRESSVVPTVRFVFFLEDGGIYWDFGPVQDEFSFIPYNILATDFRSYSLVYSCTQHYFTPTIYAWIMSRGSQLEESTIKDLENILKTNGINIDKMQQINQKDCP